MPLLHLGAAKAQPGDARVEHAHDGRRARASGCGRRLVVAEVALAVTLVVGAGLLIRSFMNLTRVDMGFDRSQLTTFGLVLPAHEVQPAAAGRLLHAAD